MDYTLFFFSILNKSKTFSFGDLGGGNVEDVFVS